MPVCIWGACQIIFKISAILLVWALLIQPFEYTFWLLKDSYVVELSGYQSLAYPLSGQYARCQMPLTDADIPTITASESAAMIVFTQTPPTIVEEVSTEFCYNDYLVVVPKQREQENHPNSEVTK